MILDYIGLSVRNILKRKMRNFMTIAGIVIGITSITIIVTVGKTGETILASELDKYGMDGVNITSQLGVNGYGRLDENAIDILKDNLSEVSDAMPLMLQFKKAKIINSVSENAVFGIGHNADKLASLTVIYGSNFSYSDIASNSRKCIVDENLALKTYKRKNIVGKHISVLLGGKYIDFEVIGVAKSQSDTLSYLSMGALPEFIYIPYTTLMECDNLTDFDQIVLGVSRDADTSKVASKAQNLLAVTTQNTGGFSAINMRQQKSNVKNITAIVAALLTLIAGISLIVSALSIMIIMVTSVGERKREIGVKKAIGAKSMDIVLEFLIESIIITITGVILGLVLGLSICFVGGYILGISIKVNFEFILFSIVFSALIGILFGVYPARKAASLSPIIALKDE